MAWLSRFFNWISGLVLRRHFVSSVAEVAPVALPPSPTAPTKLTSPSITSTNLIVGTVATATHGTYSGTVTGYTGQWLRDSSPIALATALAYTYQTADIGHSITYDEAAYNTSTLYSSVTGTSNGLGPIVSATFGILDFSNPNNSGLLALLGGI